jgi:hypothetical protein
LSGSVDKAGEVADGDIITIPLGIATFFKTAVVTPEQSAPIMALTLSEVINLSAAAWAAAASTHVESALTPSILPCMKLPELFTSSMANSALLAITGAKDSIGPVNPKIIPIFTFFANAGKIRNIDSINEIRIFFINVSPFVLKIQFIL